MESRIKFAGHPLHPMMIAFPLGLLGTAAIFDLIYMASGNTGWTISSAKERNAVDFERSCSNVIFLGVRSSSSALLALDQQTAGTGSCGDKADSRIYEIELSGEGGGRIS